MNKSLRDEIRAVLALGLVSVAFAPAVYAQEAKPQQPTQALTRPPLHPGPRPPMPAAPKLPTRLRAGRCSRGAFFSR